MASPSQAEDTSATSLSLPLLTPNDLLAERTRLDGPRQLIAVRPTATVKEAMQLLEEHRIRCLAVRSHNSDEVVSLINTFDLLDFVVTFSRFPTSPSDDDSSEIQRRGSQKLEQPVDVVTTLDSDRESYRIFKCDRYDTLKKTLEAFSSYIHYALVVDYSGTYSEPAVLTQTDVIRYVVHHPECLKDLDLDAPLESLGLLRNQDTITSVRDKDSTLHAFSVMDTHSRTCVPVLDEHGKIVANLRAFDTRFVAATHLEVLTKPVLEFLKTVGSTSLEPVTCSPKTSLREVLNGILDTHTHYVWVVDADHRPQNSISLTDLIQIFAKVQ